MYFLSDVFLGFIIGVAAITPGLSGGALAMIMGLYEPLINALSTLLTNLRRNVLFLLPFVIGGFVGVLAFSNVMEWLMQHAPDQVKLLFLGLVAGSMPALFKEANAKGFRLRYVLATLFAFVVAYLGAEIRLASQAAGHSFLHYVLYGFIYSVGSIVPGISASFILMHLGAYDKMLSAIANIDLTVLMPVGIGICLGALSLIRLVDILFRRYHSYAYYAVIGFLLGSGFLIFPKPELSWWLVRDGAVFFAGIVLSALLLKVSDRRKLS